MTKKAKVTSDDADTFITPPKPTVERSAKNKNRPLPPVHTRFQKGKSGNPGGLPRNPIPKALKNLTIDTYREVIELVCTGNVDSLKEMIDDRATSALQVGVAQAFLNALRAGDYATIERIAERIVGKIPDQVNITSSNKNLNANTEVTEDVLKRILFQLDATI